RVWQRSLKDTFIRKLRIERIGLRQLSSVPESDVATKKIPPPSKKGRLLTGSMIGLAITGGAYVSTVDEGTFCGLLFKATRIVN
ncbi:hypothetical protein, partial [Mycobacterium tuberculosis]|uniref:hypothetical protein n=1 Tax=Mycobacterium tuberculosis TaxID=1773 RepID=UPI00254B59F4